ncbi:VWA domain-containing protein [Thiomicrorhabdus heinhorstiae]|uniref:VWA domain-containing protein n=1 Tax=Thiomicrorhabdus heinhorstiae TaxID=2748010 RepID=A0ABS0BX89_9GAMM|nr:VWA domain-containing protein [Thiomicrorhabdus heinhorstiae]MBF6057695.1 VWA domain-containing protein [Thiomicrorhabdus heinhorstiae]
MIWESLQWRESLWLWGLVLPFVAAGLLGLRRRVQRRRYADEALWPWLEASQTPAGSVRVWLWQWTPLRFLGVAWMALMIALAGPRSFDWQENSEQTAGVDILSAIDLSLSMTANDELPSRFGFAKTLLESLAKGLPQKDRLGLMAFAGDAHIVAPLSFDRQLLSSQLQALQPGMLPLKGTWLELAWARAMAFFEGVEGGAKVLVVFTNGAPPFWKPPVYPEAEALLQRYQQQGRKIRLVVVGIGGSTPVTIVDKEDKSGELHANGLLVKTRLQESSLRQWAESHGGVYLHGNGSAGFMQTLLQALQVPAVERVSNTQSQIWIGYERPFILLALANLLIAFYLYGTWRGRRVLAIKSAFFGVGFVLATTVSYSPQSMAQGAEELRQAFQAYQQKDYEQAESLYESAGDYNGWFGAGAAAYKNEDLAAAVLYFRQAAWQAPDDQARAKALYNLGNSYYRANLGALAVESYRQALLYQPGYDKALHNLAVAEAMKRQQIAPKAGDDAKGEDQKGKGRSQEGAFYGGQKPKSSSDEAGFGADGDAPEGERSGKQGPLPDESEMTDYGLNGVQKTISLNSSQEGNVAQKIELQQQQLKQAQQFAGKIRQLQDDQSYLLKRLFEREAGFHADQKTAHEIPGVQPW